MSERFTRLFALPEALYAEGSPLLIEAGALLRDSQNGRLIAQLKLKNLGEKAVQAAKIRLWPQDPAGRPLGGAIEYTYLDQSAGRGDSFGAKNPIPVAEGSTRSFRAELLEVIFADGSLWTAPEGAVWAPLPSGETLETALGDPELCKQLRLERGEDCRFRPARMLDLWRCACGEAVRGETCPACGKGFFEIDRAALTAAKDERLAAEKAAREKAAAEAAERAAALAKEKAERVEKAKARRKKTGKLAALAAAALVVAAAILLGIPGLSAIQAGKAADGGDYIDAMEKYRSAADWGLFNALFHSDEKADALIPAAHYQEGEEALAEGRYEDALASFEAAGDYEDAPSQAQVAKKQVLDWDHRSLSFVGVGGYHTVALKTDGTVLAKGRNENGECLVSDWEDIVSVSAGSYHTVGLRSDGTVVATGMNSDGQCNVSGLEMVIAISAGTNHTVALKLDGTVVAVGRNTNGQCDVESWEDIVAVSAGGKHTLGLRADGTVVAVGDDTYGQCQVQDWRDIVAISAGGMHSIGLKADGTVVAAGDDRAFPGISRWTDIIAVSGGSRYTIGLKADGTAVAVGTGNYGETSIFTWSNLVAVCAGNTHTVGLCSDGTLVAVGRTDYHQCDLSSWQGIKLPN